VRPEGHSIEHPHAPELSWARRVLGPLHVTGVLWFKSAYWAMGRLPGRAVDLVILGAVTGFFFALRRVRRAIASNLEAVLGPCGFWERQRRIYRTMHAFAWCYAERYEYLQHCEDFMVAVDGREHFESASRGGAGVIFATAHLGVWETASHLISSDLGRDAHVVREEEIDPRAQEFIRRILDQGSERRYTTHFASDDPRLAILLAQALREGRIVALQADRPRVGGRSWTALLFGQTMSLPIGPAVLARAAGVCLVPIFCFREGRRRYRLCIREPIRVATDGPRAAAIGAPLQRLASEIEWAIRREPHQWFCFKRLWPEQRRSGSLPPKGARLEGAPS
jgi:KDO2-lipid IV(A) lauroyltransferase